MNATKGIQSPRDLASRKVGELHRYGHDAGIWAKGALSDDFGVKASSMVHYVGGMERTVTGPDWAPFDSTARCQRTLRTHALIQVIDDGGAIKQNLAIIQD